MQPVSCNFRIVLQTFDGTLIYYDKKIILKKCTKIAILTSDN